MMLHQQRSSAHAAGQRRAQLAAPGLGRVVRRHVAVKASDAVPGDGYMCLGLSHCFQKNDEGRLADCYLIEPLSASSLECMAAGARTSFRLATGVSFRVALTRDKAQLPKEFAGGLFCDKWEYRCEAAGRTWQRPHAQDNLMDIVPLGKVRGDFNFSLDDKRILNLENVVSDSDNIKQDLSIDVYGRKEEDNTAPPGVKKHMAGAVAGAAAAAAATAAQEDEEEEEDELDALLTA